MLVPKPMQMGQSASLPNYNEFIRNHGSLGYPQASSDFASMLTKQQDKESKHVQEETKPLSAEINSGISLNPYNAIELTKRPIDLMPGAIMLDQRSLQTLTKLAEQKDNPENGKNKLRHTSKEEFIDKASLGALSAQYESGSAGSSAIGYDRVGGTSYGKYQIASRPGTFDEFVKFLNSEAPDLARELQQGGPANTGSRKGKMPDTWKEIAEREPERFLALQEKFIEKTHFQPALDSLEESGIDTDSLTVQQVVWSTAVQHGAQGAKNIFDSVLGSMGEPDDKEFISKVYDKRSEKFSGSSTDVQNAVHNRLLAEKNTALGMLA